jgi:hypothetical protein
LGGSWVEAILGKKFSIPHLNQFKKKKKLDIVVLLVILAWWAA